jgi:hypothetical protein
MNEFVHLFSSRPGRPPKRAPIHQIDDGSDNKRMKFSSNLLLHSFPDFKYPVHSNDYLSIPLTNGNQLSSFRYSAFTPTLPLHIPSSYDTRLKTAHRSISFCLSKSIKISRFFFLKMR